MAKPREVRGWLVYGVAAGAAFLMLAFRLYYGTSGATSPSLLFPWIDVPFVIGILAGALAAIGLWQSLWYALVKPHGRVLYAASFLMFVVATLLFYSLPSHLGTPMFFYLMFVAGVTLFVYTPTLSWDSKVFLGIAVAGVGALLASSAYGPLIGSAPLLHPLVLATIGTEGLLLLGLVWLLMFAVRKPAATPT